MIPFSNIFRTAAASTLAPETQAGSRTSTTRPGNGPGSDVFVRGTFRASATLVAGLGGGAAGAFCAEASERPASSPNPAAPAAPPTLKKSRLLSESLDSIER